MCDKSCRSWVRDSKVHWSSEQSIDDNCRAYVTIADVNLDAGIALARELNAKGHQYVFFRLAVLVTGLYLTWAVVPNS
jgi:hypothetical protein